MTSGIKSDQRNYVRCYKQGGKHVGKMRDQRENQVSVIFCSLPTKIDAPTCSDVEGSNGCWLPHSWLQNGLKNVLKRKTKNCWLGHPMWSWALFELPSLHNRNHQFTQAFRKQDFARTTLWGEWHVSKSQWGASEDGADLPHSPSPCAVIPKARLLHPFPSYHG